MSLLDKNTIEKLKEEIVNSGFNYREFDLSKVDISNLHSSIQEDYMAENNEGRNFILNYEIYRERARFENKQGKIFFYEIDFDGIR